MKRRRGIRRLGITIFMVASLASVAGAADPTVVAAVASYETLALEGQTVHTPGGGLIVDAPAGLLFGQYRYSRYSETPERYDGTAFHAVETLYDGGVRRHRYVALFDTASDRPVAGGWSTFQAAAVYGYEVLARERGSIVAGGGLAVGDFGIETAQGTTWPVIPVPFLRGTYETPAVTGRFDFITGPNLGVVIAPERDVNATIDVRLDQFRDVRDLIYEVSVAYRVVSVGFKNDTFSVFPYREDEPVETFYYAAFGTVDLTLLQLTAGYAFGGRVRSGENEIDRTGDGVYVTVQGIIPLTGGGR